MYCSHYLFQFQLLLFCSPLIWIMRPLLKWCLYCHYQILWLLILPLAYSECVSIARSFFLFHSCYSMQYCIGIQHPLVSAMSWSHLLYGWEFIALSIVNMVNSDTAIISVCWWGWQHSAWYSHSLSRCWNDVDIFQANCYCVEIDFLMIAGRLISVIAKWCRAL
jgi:hypothetical protein